MTAAKQAILSLIAEQPRHGYEIEAVIQARGMREWADIGFSSIYYLLKKLEREGLIAGETETVGAGPARVVYHITRAGQRALREGTLAALSHPKRPQAHFLMGLANMRYISRAHALEALETYREALVERIVHLQAQREAQRPLPYYVEAMFDYSVSLLGTELGWVEDFTRIVEQEHDQD
jgi:DNA-binding PadR family transcriptional regulator